MSELKFHRCALVAFGGFCTFFLISCDGFDSSSRDGMPHPCLAHHKQEHWMIIDDRVNVESRIAKVISRYAHDRSLIYEANRYTRGDSSNKEPLFLVSACNRQLYLVADNIRRDEVTVSILSEKSRGEAGINPIAIAVARDIKKEFEDVDFSSDLEASTRARVR